jgi:hypothetical protein
MSTNLMLVEQQGHLPGNFYWLPSKKVNLVLRQLHEQLSEGNELYSQKIRYVSKVKGQASAQSHCIFNLGMSFYVINQKHLMGSSPVKHMHKIK